MTYTPYGEWTYTLLRPASTETRNDRACFPPGIASAMTAKGTTVIYRNGNKSSEMLRFPPKQLLAADTSDVIAQLQAEIETAVQEIAEAGRQEQHLQGRRGEAVRACRDLEDQVGVELILPPRE